LHAPTEWAVLYVPCDNQGQGQALFWMILMIFSFN